MTTRLAYRQIGEALEERQEFTGNTMDGRYVVELDRSDLGQLPSLYQDMMYRDAVAAHEAGLPFYVVYSYWTPIAWAYGDTVRVPEARYSVTTSRHQGMLYRLK